MNYATVAKKDEKSFQTEQYLCSQLNKHGWIYDKKNPELVICIGGDGTLLYGVHKYLPIINTIQVHWVSLRIIQERKLMNAFRIFYTKSHPSSLPIC